MSVPDLSKLQKPVDFDGEIPADAQVAAEVQAGLRCAGCRKRFTQGFEIISVRAALTPGGPVVFNETAFACNGIDGCKLALELAQDPRAVATRPVSWAFIQGDPDNRSMDQIGADEAESIDGAEQNASTD